MSDELNVASFSAAVTDIYSAFYQVPQQAEATMADEDKATDNLKMPVIPDNDDAMLSTKTLAFLRDVVPNRIEKERLAGDGPPWVRDGRLIRYRLGDYRAWLAAKQRFTSTSQPVAA